LAFDETGVLLQRICVPPERYDAVFHQIAARLENPRIETHPLS